MMVYRRHEKNSLFKNFKASHLQNHAQSLHDKDEADDDEQDLVFRHHAHEADICAYAEAPAIAHENLGRMAVKP